MSSRLFLNSLCRNGLVPSLAASVSVMHFSQTGNNKNSVLKCEDGYSNQSIDTALMDEEARYQSTLSKVKEHISTYREKWDYNKASSRVPTVSWPVNVPSEEELPALQTEMKYCSRSPNYRDDSSYCDQIKFRIAAAMLQSSVHDPDMNAAGLAVMKDLAERGHSDGMCFYAKCLNEGRGNLDPNPQQAVVWWVRCAELHNHVEALYELGVAYYTGEGVDESEIQAAKFFQKAAEKGHPGALFMLGDCLLDGIGVQMDRARALECLIESGERGHRGARSRVIAVLTMEEGQCFGIFTDSSRQTIASNFDAQNERIAREIPDVPVNYERKFTMGGSHPTVLSRRRTIVEQSRRT